MVQRRTKMRIVILAITLTVISGCAVQKDWVATGGSRADGTVQLAYQYGMFQSPEVSAQQGRETADGRCRAWGFSHAEPFGGEVQSCVSSSADGTCNGWRVTKDYQCIDSHLN